VKRLLDIGFWARALRNPIVLVGLAVDLAPIYGVLAWGWSAAPLVLIYWTENVISGVMTLPRIFISGANYGWKGLAASTFFCAFFTVHYGMFCTVHGIFLVALSAVSDTLHGGSAAGIQGIGDIMSNFFGAIPENIKVTLASGLHVDWILEAIIAFQIVVFVWEFILNGGWKRTNPGAELFAPYGRIIVLHFGIFAGFGALIVLGQPMVGVLALILFRVVWGVLTNDRRNDPLAAPATGAAKSFDDLLVAMQGPTPPKPPS
jgi:hypothetical protein